MEMKFQAILLAIVWIGTSFGEQGKMMNSTINHRYSATCLSGKMKVYVDWDWNEDKYIFEVVGQTTGWIGIGFSTSGNMTGADIFVGWVKSGNVNITQRTAKANGFPTLKRRQQVTKLNGSESNGLTRLTFSVPDLSFSNWIEYIPLLCAYGSNDPTGNDIREYDYHRIANIEVTCFDEYFLCQDRSQCIHNSSFCDGRKDCRDGSDEHNYKEHKIGRECDGKDSRSSPKRCLLPERYVCDGTTDCVDGFDELMCDHASKTGYLDNEGFRCLRNPEQIIPITRLCNGVFDCFDLTDECICERNKRRSVCSMINIVVQTRVSQLFVCGNTSFSTHIEKICDNVNDCETSIDEEYCNKVQCSDILGRGKNISENDKCGFRCLIGNLYATRCDRTFECRYAYYEECRFGNRRCENPPRICNNFEYAFGVYCEDENGTERYIDPEDICNGVEDCLDGKDERDCQIRIVKLYCEDPDGSKKYIYGSDMCNGVKDCSDGIDETDCVGRFYCANGSVINIPNKQKCDQRLDCDDGSDEFNCSFSCNDSESIKLIDTKKVCDGKFDCKKGRDECLTKCITSAFSSVKSLISSRGLLGVIWILSVVAFLGNFSVGLFSIREFLRFKREDGVIRKLNKSLVFNLSLSDLLVGIYLISICIQNLINEGDYCKIDRDWRSGMKCSALGAVLLVGSEQSVFTMTIITGVRLYTVARPMGNINVRLIKLLVALSWIISISLAIIPLIPQTQDYFVDSIRYQDNQLFATIKREDVEYYTKWLLLTNKYANESQHFGHIGSWSLLEHLIGKLNTNYTVHGKFGYYSKHGVCVAPLFPDPKKDTSWIYTFLILSVNFLSFFFILSGYVAIYCINKKQRRKIQKKPDVNMQKKITRIIVTDFFCWMPICIMGMLQVSGIKIPTDAYVFVGMILIPINSALNPFLYSDAPEYIWQKIEPLRAWIYRHFTSVRNRVINFCGRSNDDQREVHVETIEMRVIEEVRN